MIRVFILIGGFALNYWLNIYTGTTWDEFRAAGSKISGFNHRMRNSASKIKPNDIMLCYVTGVKRWVGALRVVGSRNNTSKIYSDAVFPVRFEVNPIVQLEPANGLPMEDLEGSVDFYRSAGDRGGFRGFVRRSPNLFKLSMDGDLILSKVRALLANPLVRPVDPKKLARKPFFVAQQRRGRESVQTVVSVPGADTTSANEDSSQPVEPPASTTRHTEIQFHLLDLGASMGLDVWVARNDRGRLFDGHVLGSMARMISELPTQFNDATNRTIELIDVLWLKGNSIVAAFEVESTTAIYSGLLRMSDLIALQPNLEIRLFIVAPDERQEKVETEILRPTFSLREKPLSKVCAFLPFSDLMEKIDGIKKLGLASSLKPEFLEQMAIYFSTDSD